MWGVRGSGELQARPLVGTLAAGTLAALPYGGLRLLAPNISSSRGRHTPFPPGRDGSETPLTRTFSSRTMVGGAAEPRLQATHRDRCTDSRAEGQDVPSGVDSLESSLAAREGRVLAGAGALRSSLDGRWLGLLTRTQRTTGPSTRGASRGSKPRPLRDKALIAGEF